MGAVRGAPAYYSSFNKSIARNHFEDEGLSRFLFAPFTLLWGLVRGAYLGAKYPDKVTKISAVVGASSYKLYLREKGVITSPVITKLIDGKEVYFDERGMRIYKNVDDILNETEQQTKQAEMMGNEIYRQELARFRGDTIEMQPVQSQFSIQGTEKSFPQAQIQSINQRMNTEAPGHKIVNDAGITKIMGRNPLLAIAKCCPEFFQQSLVLEMGNLDKAQAKQYVEELLRECIRDAPDKNLVLPKISVKIDGKLQEDNFVSEILKKISPVNQDTQIAATLRSIEGASAKQTSQPPANPGGQAAPPLTHTADRAKATNAKAGASFAQSQRSPSPNLPPSLSDSEPRSSKTTPDKP